MNVLHGDMGPSFKYPGRSVNDIIREGFPVFLQLGLESLALALLLGIPAGLAAALKRNQWQDRVINCFATLGMAVPSFVVAALLIDVFALRLGILPAAMWSSWKSQILPAVALAGGPLSIIARLTRSSILDVLEQDYIKTARAKGLSEVCVRWKHALPNSLIPIVTYVGPMAAGIVVGSFVIETIFAIPGLGHYFVTSIYDRDYTVIMGVTLLYSMLVILMNMLVDLAYPLLDPRIKLGRKGD